MLSSCEKFIERTPYNAVETSEAFKTPEDFTNAIRGVYSGIRREGYWGDGTSSFVSTPDVISDNLIMTQIGRHSQQSLYQWNFSSNNTWYYLWQDAYKVVSRSNAILENIEVLGEGTFKDNVKGEALATRAMAHFDLLRLFSKAPKLAGADDMGVPYMESTDASQNPERPTVAEAYAKVLADLTAAEELISSDNGAGRLNKAGVNALLVRYYLTNENWTNAIAAGTKVEAEGARVSSMAAFSDVWKDNTNDGVILKILISEMDRISPGTQYSQSSSEGIKSEYVVDYAFYSMYTDTDVRKSAYFVTSDFSGQTYNHIAKYSGRDSGSKDVVDTKAIRMAEVVLSMAEAFYNSGDEANAIKYLDMLRSERYSDYAPTTVIGSDLLNLILLERRKELAFEGFRFFDIKRLNLAIERSDYGDFADGTGAPVPDFAKTLPAGDYKFELAIPQNELNANGNMLQNPGY